MNDAPPEAFRPWSGVDRAESILPSATRLWKVFSLLWIGPSAGALWIILQGPARYRGAGNVREVVTGIALEEWIAFGLLVLHLSFMMMWWRGSRREKRQHLSKNRENSF